VIANDAHEVSISLRYRRLVIYVETERALGADEEAYSCTLTIPDDAIAPLLTAYRRKAPVF